MALVHGSMSTIKIKGRDISKVSSHILAYYEPKSHQWILSVEGFVDVAEPSFLEYVQGLSKGANVPYSYHPSSAKFDSYTGQGSLKAAAIESTTDSAVSFKIQIVME